ncbi:MAG: aspartate aminotransferase family protein, partial [Flavobacteriales bacterium]
NVGHCHPEVIKALKEQIDNYLHIMPFGEYKQEPQEKLASRLIGLLPANIEKVFLVNSGTEAIEGAIKLAKRYTEKTDVISMKNSYHGSLMSDEERKRKFRPLIPATDSIHINDHQKLDRINKNTACVIIEPIQGDAGVRIPNPSYLKALRNKCNETGTLLIFDEIQTGFGRTGKMFAYEHTGVLPDIITLAKGMGGGMPIGAFAASENIMKTLSFDPILGHITTFGGNPVSCAAASASINVIIKEKLCENADKMGDVFREKLRNMFLKNVRGKGLMIAFDLKDHNTVRNLVEKCYEKGLLLFWFLSSPGSVRIYPPLTINEEEVQKSCKILENALKEIH